MKPYILLPVAMLCVSSLANAQTGLYNNEFALQDVELLDGPFRPLIKYKLFSLPYNAQAASLYSVSVLLNQQYILSCAVLLSF